MTFIKVNDQVLRCIVTAQEADNLGFSMEEVFSNREKAVEFIRCIADAAISQGYIEDGTYHYVNQIRFENNEFVMNLVSVKIDTQIDTCVSKILSAYDMVNLVGRERFEEILRTSGEQKAEDFNKIVGEMRRSLEQKPLEQQNCKYVIKFSSLDDAENFSESVDNIGDGSLYKSDDKYYMYVDLDGIENDVINSFLLTAEEFGEYIVESEWCEPYLKEHAQIIIKEHPISVLKNL